jgi:hypothetical protein
MVSIAVAVEPLGLPPASGGARRRALMFPGEALRLIATLVLRSDETAADSGKPPINPMQLSEMGGR